METGRRDGGIRLRRHEGMCGSGNKFLQLNEIACGSAGREWGHDHKTADAVAKRGGAGGCRAGMMRSGCISARHCRVGTRVLRRWLMLYCLRRLLLGKGHDWAVRQAHEAEQHGNNDPKAWAKGSERPHGFYLGVADRRRQLTFGNPGLILTPRRGRRMSARMTMFDTNAFLRRRRATMAPARDRM